MVILSAMFQEKQIIFASRNANLNVMVMETLLEIIHPLKWEYMYVPNLPSEMLEAAQECFIPCMIGVSMKELDRIPLKGKIVVYVDNGYIEVNEPIF
jgi:hypothetical protein